MKLLIALGQTAFAWTWKTSIHATLLIVRIFWASRDHGLYG